MKLFTLVLIIACSLQLSVGQDIMMEEPDEKLFSEEEGTRALRGSIPKLYKCPPEPEYVTSWYCPWCNPTKDTTKVDMYDEIMDLYDGYGSEDAPKAITVWFGKSTGKVGSFSDDQLVRVFQAASSGNSCVRETFQDAVCVTLEYSDFFRSSTLSNLQKLKALKTFTSFVIGFARGDPWAVAKNTRKLMQDVVLPTMYRLIGGISFMVRTDPANKFERDLILQCSIH
eukprot:scaffold39323_cov176-Amphora_coffeaeformis.AAC.3